MEINIMAQCIEIKNLHFFLCHLCSRNSPARLVTFLQLLVIMLSVIMLLFTILKLLRWQLFSFCEISSNFAILSSKSSFCLKLRVFYLSVFGHIEVSFPPFYVTLYHTSYYLENLFNLMTFKKKSVIRYSIIIN